MYSNDYYMSYLRLPLFVEHSSNLLLKQSTGTILNDDAKPLIKWVLRLDGKSRCYLKEKLNRMFLLLRNIMLYVNLKIPMSHVTTSFTPNVLWLGSMLHINCMKLLCCHVI